MNVFGGKAATAARSQALSFDWLPGAAMANLFNLYPSLGDFTSSGPVNIVTDLDGPIKVVRYGALTLNHVLTVSNRCRGLVILCDSFTGGAAGGINMTARGAAGQAWWPWYNLTVPQKLAVASKYMSQREVLQYFADKGYFIGDPVIWTQAMSMGFAGLPGVTGTLTEGVKILEAARCGARRNFITDSYAVSTQYSWNHGNTGNAGTQNAGKEGGTGGGGGGGVANPGNMAVYQFVGGRGTPWGGGPGGGGAMYVAGAQEGVRGYHADDYGGKGGSSNYGGGGAGNPGGAKGYANDDNGGDGTGGVFAVICGGAISLASGFVAQCDGVAGGSARTGGGVPGGGGSGGGFQAWIRGTGQSLTNSGTRRCNGGAGGSYINLNGMTPAGGAGGVGVVADFQFSDLGF